MGPGVRRDDGGYGVAFSRHDLSELIISFCIPENSEGAGKTGCALPPRSRMQMGDKECAHEHTGSAESIRPSLRSGFTAYFVLSPENGFFASVIARDFSRAT